MRFKAFPEIQLNSGMRDIGDYWWAKSTHTLTPSKVLLFFGGKKEQKTKSRYSSYNANRNQVL